ncbi:hypothetical protein [Ralstonia sp. AU12-08]|uniref:hypothetical protein n=1 Tax=Ralstonia sp. AU12-08 TaxID=1235457 RepID=UPI000386DCE6|nr:hypothetical protein [Ralstonia sp. AU12-08]EPX96754.1 hypothetical protein C404_17245 [Ralstonia sp. AU12-08]
MNTVLPIPRDIDATTPPLQKIHQQHAGLVDIVNDQDALPVQRIGRKRDSSVFSHGRD